jgi:glycosyltransferase involved in cell wall biosynthesis
MRVGLVVEAKIDPAAWSGIYAGVAAGLRAHGAEVVELNISLPGKLEHAALRQPSWRVRAALRQLATDRQVRRARGLDALLQLGTSAVPRTNLPLALYTDMTLSQGIAVGDQWVNARSQTDLQAWELRQREVYRRAGRVLALGDWAAQSVIADYGVPADRVSVVGAGISHDVAPRPRDWSTPRFLFIGRDFERKNGSAVMRAFTQLRARNPEARLDVVGGHPSLDAPGVTGHGPLALGSPRGEATIRSLLSAATCFVMPSQYEPFGIAYVEAAAAGVPSIATTVGASFVVPECGIRVDPTDEAALLHAMRRLSDGARARRLGERATERAALFTWPQVGGRILRALCELTNRSGESLPAEL